MTYIQKYSSIKGNFAPFLAAITIFISCYPCMVWQYFDLIQIVCPLLLLPLFIINIKSGAISRSGFLWFFLAIVLFSVFRQRSIAGFILLFPIAFISIVKSDFLERTFIIFKWILAIVFTLSIISLTLFLVGLNKPINVLEPLNELKNHQYVHFPFLLIPTHVDTSELFRFYSILDEPGAVGTYCALILIYAKYNLKDKINIVFLVAGILSFSLFFFIISIFYLAATFTTAKKALLIIGVFIAFYLVTKDVEMIKTFLWERLEFNEGSLAGNNRNSEEFSRIFYANFFTYKMFVTGYGYKFVEPYMDSASIQLVIMRDGLLFVAVFLLGLFRYIRGVVITKKDALLLFVLCILTLYQRPGFINIEYIFLFVLCAISWSKSNLETVNNTKIC